MSLIVQPKEGAQANQAGCGGQAFGFQVLGLGGGFVDDSLVVASLATAGQKTKTGSGLYYCIIAYPDVSNEIRVVVLALFEVTQVATEGDGQRGEASCASENCPQRQVAQ